MTQVRISVVCDTSKGSLYKQIKPPLVVDHAFPLTGFVCETAHITPVADNLIWLCYSLLYFRDHLETGFNRERLFKKRFGPPAYRTVYYKPKVVLEKLCLTSRNDEESSPFSILTFALLSSGCLQMAKLLGYAVDADWHGINHFRTGVNRFEVIQIGT